MGYFGLFFSIFLPGWGHSPMFLFLLRQGVFLFAQTTARCLYTVRGEKRLKRAS